MSIQVCRDASDAVAFYLPQRLYLKSFAKLNISVQLPSHKVHGKAISNWELMEKLRKMIQPDSFSILKVSKHSSEVIRFDAELENIQKLDRVLGRLEDRIIQLNDYPDPLKVKVSEAKSDFPSRHTWDSYFRDASDMDEMKPGERPDTIHIKYLPIRWFVHNRDRDEDALPSESIFKKAFEKFGAVRQIDVPAADPFRMQMKVPMRGITIPIQEGTLYFEGYVQYSEYAGFVRCMDSLRARKLLRKSDDLAEWCSIKVDFDKTKHMTDAAVKRRAIVRERLAARQRAKEEEENKEKEKIAHREARERQKIEHHENEKLIKMREREERRKKKQLAKLMEREDVDLNKRVSEEQRKLLKTQKKLQAIRLIDELFKRIELRPELQRNSSKPERYYNAHDRLARQRIVDSYKRQQEKEVEDQRERLRHAVDGRIVIRSALETKKPKRNSSVSSISDEENRHKRVKSEKKSPERDPSSKNPGMYYPGPYGFGYPFPPHGYPFPQTSMYYPMRGAYYHPPPDGYTRRPMRARGRGRGRGRLPYFDGPDATQQYYQYFKKLNDAEHRNEHDNRSRSRSRSRSHSRRRSYSRSRSRSRRRSYSRSRSRSRRSRSRSRSRRSRSRKSRSRSRRSRSYSRSNSRSRRNSRSRSRRSKTRSRSKSKHHTPSPKSLEQKNGDDKDLSLEISRRQRSKSWSLPKDGEERKSWAED